MKNLIVTLIAIISLSSFFMTAHAAGNACSDSFACQPGEVCENSICKSTSPGGGPVQTNSPGGGSIKTEVKINNPFNVCGASGCGLLDFLNAIIDNVLMPIAGVLIVLAFIWTGFQYVVAQGNPGKIKDATQMLKFTVIGAIILLGAAAITHVISGTLDQFKTLK